jgi:histidyl-tRNA synthetase
MEQFQSVKGFNDQLPDKVKKIKFLENITSELFNQRGFDEIRTPIVEFENIFKRSVGETSDIVSKEMYTITKEDNKSISLRPEGTVGVARSLLQNNLTNTIQKLWYNGYMFRAENPQKGRYRQFQQIGVEAYGISSVNIEIELLNLTYTLFSKLNLIDSLTLEINCIGSIEDRQKYCEALKQFFKSKESLLDPKLIQQIEKNPLRVLDSKDPRVKELVKDAPVIYNYISEKSKNDFSTIQNSLTALGIPFFVNNTMVRGLDYYNDLVFEWTSNLSTSQGTVCAGGRYDSLLSQLGGKETPSFGFAIGVERIILLMEELNLFNSEQPKKIALCLMSPDNYIDGLLLQQKLITILNMEVMIINEQTSIRSQMKKVDKSNCDYAIILGSQEIYDNTFTIKDLKIGQQQTLDFESLISYLKI